MEVAPLEYAVVEEVALMKRDVEGETIHVEEGTFEW